MKNQDFENRRQKEDETKTWIRKTLMPAFYELEKGLLKNQKLDRIEVLQEESTEIPFTVVLTFRIIPTREHPTFKYSICISKVTSKQVKAEILFNKSKETIDDITSWNIEKIKEDFWAKCKNIEI